MEIGNCCGEDRNDDDSSVSSGIDDSVVAPVNALVPFVTRQPAKRQRCDSDTDTDSDSDSGDADGPSASQRALIERLRERLEDSNAEVELLRKQNAELSARVRQFELDANSRVELECAMDSLRGPKQIL